MEALIRKRLIQFSLGFSAIALLIAGAFIRGELSSRETGISYLVLCGLASILLTAIVSSLKRSEHVAEPPVIAIDLLSRRKIMRTVRNYKIVVIVMPLILVFACWGTRGDPLLPRLIGAAINLVLTFLFVVALRAQQAKLGEKQDREKQSRL